MINQKRQLGLASSFNRRQPSLTRTTTPNTDPPIRRYQNHLNQKTPA